MNIIVTEPAEMNGAFARAFNTRDINILLSLYEPEAVLLTDSSGRSHVGIAAIARELQELLQAQGTMRSQNKICVLHDNVALLRAEWTLAADDGSIVVSGSSAEVVRRQADGRWLYVIDHAVGADAEREAR